MTMKQNKDRIGSPVRRLVGRIKSGKRLPDKSYVRQSCNPISRHPFVVVADERRMEKISDKGEVIGVTYYHRIIGRYKDAKTANDRAVVYAKLTHGLAYDVRCNLIHDLPENTRGMK